jgi:Tfp pilus assembly protein PilW
MKIKNIKINTLIQAGFTRSVNFGDAFRSKRALRMSPKSTAGFTLIEIMIATGLFVVVMVVGVGAVLNVNTTYRKTQKIRSIVDNLGFSMEDMSKTLRTGVTYACPGVPVSAGSSFTISGTVTCSVKNYAIEFQSTSGLDTMYAIVGGALFKSTTGGTNFIRMTPQEIVIDPTRSGFTVVGNTSGDSAQSRVIINLEGSILYRDNTSNFALQTTVVSRVLDN